MYKRNYDSFCIYRLWVSKYKRNHIENEVVMVATESQTIFTWSMAISIVLTEYESYKMTHTYNEEGNKEGNHEQLNWSEFLKQKQRSTDRIFGKKLLEGNAGTHGRTHRSEFEKK